MFSPLLPGLQCLNSYAVFSQHPLSHTACLLKVEVLISHNHIRTWIGAWRGEGVNILGSDPRPTVVLHSGEEETD